MKTLELSAGKRTRIIRNFSNSIPMSYYFTAESMAKGKNKDISGKVEVCGSNWIFPRQPLVLELNKNNMAKKRAWDSFYSIYVTPKIDTRIVFQTYAVQHFNDADSIADWCCCNNNCSIDVYLGVSLTAKALIFVAVGAICGAALYSLTDR